MSQPSPSRSQEPCPSCGVSLEVGGESFFATVRCPQCHDEVIVRRMAGPYFLVEVLGQGGSGKVFRARREGEADVALKVLDKESEDYHENLRLLRNEANCGRAVDHPNVVKVLDLEEDDEGARLIMELMEGGSLHDRIVSGDKIPERLVLQLGVEILKALEAIQELGMSHRDLKPANILFSAEGVAKLGDFGLARGHEAIPVSQSHLFATPDYVAPEILGGFQGDLRSEFYSLGGCLYHALAGKPPYDTEGLALSELQRIKATQVRMDEGTRTNQETRELIDRMMTPDPDFRFQTCADVELKLMSALKSLGSPGLWRRGNRRSRSRNANPRSGGVLHFLFRWINRN